MKEYKMEIGGYGKENQLQKDLIFWSDALGELKHGESKEPIEEGDLPKELATAYHELWTNRYMNLCYLAEYQGQYGVALVNEFDSVVASNENTDIDNLYSIMVKRIMDMEESAVFAGMIFMAGQWTGFGDCHEAILFVPWNTPKERLERAARIFDNIYSANEDKRQTLSVRRLTSTAKMIESDSTGAPWFALFADISAPITIPSGRMLAISTGLEILVPKHCVGEIHARGKLASEKGLCPVDSLLGGDDYMEIRVVLLNRSKETQTINPGEKIARLVIQQCAEVEVEEG